MIYVDSDNAMGGTRGDVDDGFAIAAMHKSKLPVSALGSIYGNTSEDIAHGNHRRLAKEFQWEIPLIRGASDPGQNPNPVSKWLVQQPASLKLLAIGPLTNFGNVIANSDWSPSEIIVVGGNLKSYGRWPPLYPFEFNLTHDRWATQRVFRSDWNITLIPLEVCGRLRIRKNQVETLGGGAGKFLYRQSRRWFSRAKWLKLSHTVPIWDLVAAMYVISPDLFSVRETMVHIHPNGHLQESNSGKKIKVVYDFSPVAVWSRFETFFRVPG